MLWKHESAGPLDNEGYTCWRYWCDCGSALHVLEIDADSAGQLHLAVYDGYKKTFWQRLKMAVSLLFNGETCPVDIYLCDEDRQELAAVIGKEIIV